MKRTGKSTKKSVRGKLRSGRVPTYEEFLTFLLDSVAFDPDGRLSSNCISATKKRRLRRFDRNPRGLDVSAYKGIVRKLLDQHKPGIRALGKPWAEILEDELRQMMGRYEQLVLSLSAGNANARQVRWSLCVRFFVPWAALRIAFRLRHSPPQSARADRWFVLHANGKHISSCFMEIIDGQVRHNSETDTALALRLQKGQAGDKEDLAKSLTRDFRRYRTSSGTASDPTLNAIIKATPNLRAKLVLARAIDRMVQGARKAFGAYQTVKLVKFFRISFDHFTQLLRQLHAELPSDEELAWQALQSQTFTGNTPFEADRYWPLTDIYLHGLARKISAELQKAKNDGRLAYVPTSQKKFREGAFELSGWTPIPDGIHEGVRSGDYRAAVNASQSIVTNRSPNPKQMASIADFFSHTALMAYDPDTSRCALVPIESDLPYVLEEAGRLFDLAFQKAKGVEKTEFGIKHLRFLLAPQRPKTKAERPLAWRLYRVADKFYRESGRSGSSKYLLGCLLWLEGNEKRAVQAFLSAIEEGRASFAEYDWIHLLRYAPILARRTSSKRGLNRVLKISELEGVLHRESAPKTSLLEKELRQRGQAEIFELTVKPFPR